MALLGSTFVADDVEDTSFKPVPPGVYTVQIVGSEMKPTKAGTGEYLQLKLAILDEGEYNGRVIFELLNLVNPNEKAVQIAMSTLKKICKALNVASFEDSQELHGIPFKAAIKIQAGTGGYDDSNKVAKYLPLDDAEGEGGDPPW